jgi:hypothetical protein
MTATDKSTFRTIEFTESRKALVLRISETVAYAEQQTGCKVRHLRLNNAPEFRGGQLLA